MDGQTDGGTDGQGDSYIPPQTLFAGGIITLGLVICWMSKVTGFRIHKVFKKRVLKKYLGTINFCWMSQDVRKLRCQIA